MWGDASRICSKYHRTFLYSSYVAFSSYTRWGIHTVVLTQPQHGRNLILFISERSGFHMINNLSIAVHTFTRHILTLLSMSRYVNWSTDFKSLLSGDGSFLFKTWILLFLHSHKGQQLLLIAPGYAAGIQLGQVYLWEVLDHLHSLHLL